MFIPKGEAVLTKEFLLNTPKNLRQQEIFYHICSHKIDDDILEQFERVSRLAKGYQMIYVLWHLQGEVNNGGYCKYFDNFENCNKTKQPYYDLTINFLKMIGCIELSHDYLGYLCLYRKWEELRENSECNNKCTECNKCAAFDKKSEKFDSRFYENEKFFIQAIDDYIDANLDDFVSFSDTAL